MRALLLSILAALATAAPASAADIEVTARERLSPRLTELTLRTPALDFPAKVRVLLPAGYAAEPRRRYPVLYLLHGSFDDSASWTAKGDAERLTADLPLIVVMPPAAGTGDAGGWATDWHNEGRGGSPMWETFTIGQLIPWVDATYRTRPRRAGRAITGLSMGGFGAMSLAARHPDRFAAAASYSGAVDTNNPLAHPVVALETLADGGRTPDAIWGSRLTDEIRWRAHNPWDLAGNLAGLDLTVRTGNGTPGSGDPPLPDPIEAGVHAMSAAFHTRLDALGVEHLYDDYGAGTHTWPYWRRDLERDLPRLMAVFADPPPPPRRIAFRAAEPAFGAYGWRVRFDRDRLEFAELARAHRRGFLLRGSGAATVRTPRLYRPRSRQRVTVGDAARVLRAGPRGRLLVPVDLAAGAAAVRISRPAASTRP